MKANIQQAILKTIFTLDELQEPLTIEELDKAYYYKAEAIKTYGPDINFEGLFTEQGLFIGYHTTDSYNFLN